MSRQTTGDPRFMDLIKGYVYDEANGLILKGKAVEKVEIESHKSETFVGWRVKVHYFWSGQPSIMNRLAKANVKEHQVSLEQLMGWMWVRKG